MIRFFATHPTAANLLMLGILAIGIAVAPSVKRETFPEIPAEEIEVRAAFPGATAEEVEDAVCQRIEDAVDGIEDLDEKRCEAREGLAIAVMAMREGAAIDRFLDDVKTEVEAIDSFPDDVEAPVVRQLGRTDYVASVALSGPMSAPDLKAHAEAIKDRLMRIRGVAVVTVGGFSDHQIRIEVPHTALRQYGLSVDDLARVVADQSVDLPTGSLETTDETVLVRFADERRSPRAFEDLVVVAASGGAEIRLGDIARITDTFELDEDKILFNGRRAALLAIEKGKDDDTLAVIADVKTFLEHERAVAPPDMLFAVTQDISSIVEDRLTMLLDNGAQGLALVFLTMWLFFGLRYSFWVAMGLPVSFMGTIAAMALLGYSFDMITMVGLLIAVGLLMDDAIVISENIAAHRRAGKPPVQAAVDGTLQVAPGVVSSYLTTVCVFGGLAFMQGHIGAVMRVMPVILIATLTVSLVEAFLILPHHLHGALEAQGRRHESWMRRHVDAAMDWTRETVIGGGVDWALRWRYLTVGLALALFLASVAAIAGGVLKFRAFPDLDGDVIEVRLLLPQGTPLARTEQVVTRLTDALAVLDDEFAARHPEGLRLIRNIGVQFNKNQDAYETGPHVATVSADLLESERRIGTLDQVLNRWRELAGTVPDAIMLKFTERELGPAGRAIDIRLAGHDLGELKAAALELQGWLGGYRGVHDLSDDLRPGKPEVQLRLRAGAKGLGVSAADIAAQLRSALQGRTADEIQVGSESYEIDIRLAAADRDSLADLDYFTVTLPDGKQVPLDAVAALEPGRGHARINRVDGRRTVTVQGEVDTTVANAAEIVRDTRREFLPDLAERHPGVQADFEGQAKESATTSRSIVRNFVLGLAGVFLILSFQFRSYVEPIVVMTIIPLALIGVVLGHLAQGLELSMPSMVGMASLAGVVVNDSILLVRFIKLRAAEGLSVPLAARAASRQRFRAIFLTSLTTVIGLVPMLAETSLQAQVLRPLVTSIAFGLTGTTVLVLFVVPAFYAILDDVGLARPVERDPREDEGEVPVDVEAI